MTVTLPIRPASRQPTDYRRDMIGLLRLARSLRTTGYDLSLIHI